MNIQRRPICYIIGGPNGAGKTTFALNCLCEITGCRNFVNADLIAYGLSPLDSIAAEFEAGKIFLNEIEANIAKRADFAFETTLSGKSYLNLINKLKNDGWKIVLFFLWIPDAEFSKFRVAERVKNGGHSIPEDAIYRRYPRIMYNLFNLYIPLCDKIVCYDNSNTKPAAVFEQTRNNKKIINRQVYEKILRTANESKNK